LLAPPGRSQSWRQETAYEKVEHQYRFKDIVDLDDGKVLFTIEHEVRSTSHPLYGRQLVNRSSSAT